MGHRNGCPRAKEIVWRADGGGCPEGVRDLPLVMRGPSEGQTGECVEHMRLVLSAGRGRGQGGDKGSLRRGNLEGTFYPMAYK